MLEQVWRTRVCDKRAKDILLKANWRGYGIGGVTADDFQYAKSKGYMFDDIVLTHDQAVSQLIEERNQATIETKCVLGEPQ
jgi:hypothetical protein